MKKGLSALLALVMIMGLLAGCGSKEEETIKKEESKEGIDYMVLVNKLNPLPDDWQDGVAEYKDHNCADIADLNADMGQEWIALYTVKSQDKGDPILADSLTLQYGSKDMPEAA